MPEQVKTRTGTQQPEKKIGPFPGGIGVAICLNTIGMARVYSGDPAGIERAAAGKTTCWTFDNGPGSVPRCWFRWRSWSLRFGNRSTIG